MFEAIAPNLERPITQKPMVQKITTSMGTIYVLRNPITQAWILNLTLSKKEPTMRNNMSLAYLAYVCTFIALVLFMVGCESPTSNNLEDKVIATNHPFACIESYPVVPDTIIKGLEKWSLKVGDGPRNRCHMSTAWGEDSEGVDCWSKEKDTLWIVTDYCPATRQALNEMGG